MTMNPKKGYYSIIQYCPDLSRFEAANIGVLLFCPESHFLQAMTNTKNSRIIRFFGREGHDWSRISTIKKSLQDRLEKEHRSIRSVDDLQQFIATRANVIQITDPLPMKVFDPERDLRDLYEQMIGEPHKPARRETLRKKLEKRFAADDLRKKVLTDVKIDVPVLEREVEIPFAFRNGKFNLINPVRFRAQDPERSVDAACKYAVEGRSIYGQHHQHFGDMQLVVVGEFLPNDHRTRSRVQRVFDDSHVKLFSSREVPSLIDEIRRTGKNIDGTEQD